MKTPNRTSFKLGATQTNGTSADRMHTPAIDDQVMVVTARSAAHHARHDQRAGPSQRRNQREERGGMKRAGARPQDDQHADKSERGRQPTAQSHALSEKDDRERGDE